MAKDNPRREEDEAARKADFDAFLKRGATQREELQKNQAADKSQREQEAAAREKRARQNIAGEEAHTVKQKAELAAWQQKEKQRTTEIEAEKKKKNELEELLIQKQEQKRVKEAQKKEYMRNLQWAAAIDRLRKRREREAKEAKLQMVNDAESETKQRKDRISQQRRSSEHALTREAQEERSDVDIEEERRCEKIDEDIHDRKSKLYAKEQTEKSNFGAEMLRKRSLLRDIGDPSLKQRRKDELDREEKQMLQRIRTKYQQLTTSLEIERTQRIDAEHKNAKKARDLVAADERKALEQSRQQALAGQSQADSDLAQKRRDAKGLQREILGMTFEEVAERDEEQKKK